MCPSRSQISWGAGECYVMLVPACMVACLLLQEAGDCGTSSMDAHARQIIAAAA